MLTANYEPVAAAGPHKLFIDHHSRIEAACKALRACAYGGDTAEVIARYRSLERAVLEHLRAEEESILPAYAEHAPADAALIRATHDAFRAQLFRIGVDVELHCVRAEALDRLIADLGAHAAHEEHEMYPWADAHLPSHTKRDLFKRMTHSLRVLARDAERFARPKHAANRR